MPFDQRSDTSSGVERRTMRRFHMKLPASMRVLGESNDTRIQTENVSARGVFFYMDRAVAEGATVEITMSFPPQITMADELRVRMLARVLRVEPSLSSSAGVAAEIKEYEFLRPQGDPQSPGMEPGWYFPR